MGRHTKLRNRILPALLVLLMLIGLFPSAALAATPETTSEISYRNDMLLTQDSREDLPALVSADDFEIAKKVDLTLADNSNSVVAPNGKDGTDLRAAVMQSMESMSAVSDEELGYVEGVARSLTVADGIIGLEGYGANDEVYVLVWLQELPNALDRIYQAQNLEVADYAQAASHAASARSTIRAMGAPSTGLRAAPSLIQIEYEYSEIFAGFAVRATKNAIAGIAAMPGVYAVTEVGYASMDDYIPDPTYSTVGNAGAREVTEIADLHADEIDGRGVKVGVIDSGIDATHPDLVGAYKNGYNFADKTADMTKPDGSHGTHVSGTIASQGTTSLGVAPGVDLYMAQVFTATRPNQANEADINAALEAFSAGDVEKGLPRVDIINMSLGNTVNTAYSSDRYTRNNTVLSGVLIVCSGGNNAYPENNTTDRRNYTLGSGGVSLPLAVAAAKYGGDPLLGYDMIASAGETSNTISVTVENSDGSLSGLYSNGAFGYTDAHTVAYDATNTGSNPNIWLDAEHYGTYTRQPLEFTPGKGYELHYACTSTADMTAGELTALKALPKDSLVGKILVVNRGQSFTQYLGEALRLGAGAVIVLNRDESIIGNMVIGNVSAANMSVFSGPVSGRQKLLEVVAAGSTAYFNPGALTKEHYEMEPADFSSIGPVNETAHIKPDIIAPGWNILSTSLDGGYEVMGGTSMSSPFVAGVAALVKQHNPDATPTEIKARIMNTANPDLIKPLSSRLVSPNYYFDPAGTEISVFEQGAGFVDPKRAVYADIYITVQDNDVPTGHTDKGVMTAQMASFSFGQTNPDTDSKTLTATVHGGTLESIDVIYNHDTRYSNKNQAEDVTVNFEINADSFDVWLTIAETACTDQINSGNLYEGYIVATVSGTDYVLPWATRVGEFKEPESDYWLIYPDRPVQATYGNANQDLSPYSSQNFIYFMFDGKEIADAVTLTVSGNATSGYTYTMYVYLLTAPDPALAYRYPVTIATGQSRNNMKLSDFITIGETYYESFNGRAYRLNAQGTSWSATLSSVAAGSYNLSLLHGSSYHWYSFNGITFSNTRPTLTVEGFTFDNNYNTTHPVPYGAEEATVNGRIYSAALAQAAGNGFAWCGLYTMLLDEIFYLDQSYNVLMDYISGWECEYNAIVGPYICDADGNFSLTFPLQDDGYFFPESFSYSGAIYATDSFGLSRLGFDATTGDPVIMSIGSLASFAWSPRISVAEPDVIVTSATLTNGTLTAQVEMQDGTLPVDFDPAALTAELFVNGQANRTLTDVNYDAATGVATWTFAPYAKAAAVQVITATVTCAGSSITTDASSNAITVSAGLVANVRAAQAEYNIGELVEFIVSLVNVTNDGIIGINYVELTFTVDGSVLAGNGATPLDGFITRGGVHWAPLGDDLWEGTIRLEIEGESILSEDMDVLKLLFNPRGPLGATSFELTGIKAQGLTEDRQYVTLGSVLGNATADINLVPVPIVYSKFDLNRDGRVDSLDFGILLFYIGRSETDADWETYWFVKDTHGEPIFANLCDVNNDGTVDMGDLIDMLANYN